MLGKDVDWAKKHIVSALNILSNESGYKMYPKVGDKLNQRFHDYYFANVDEDLDIILRDDSKLGEWCKDLDKHKDDIEREKYHMIKVLEHKTNTNFRILYHSEDILFNAFEEYCREDYISYNYCNDHSIRDMLNIVCAAQKMGNKYVIGRSMNLWANKVLEDEKFRRSLGLE